jgi:energy-converting hydrogenase Eha subunit B
MELRKMAKILKSGNVVPVASLGRFIAGISVVAIGAFMVASWAASIFASPQAFITGLFGSWPVGIFGVGVIAAAGVWLGEGIWQHAGSEAKIGQMEVSVMANPVMVNPQVAFAASRVK